MELSLFDEVADLTRGLVPPDLGEFRERHHRYGIKVWFNTVKPPREHYEAQVVGAKYVTDASVLALEVGFHAENSDAGVNDATLAPLLKAEKKWRRVLGKEAVAGEFLGGAPSKRSRAALGEARPRGADVWRRVSETWADPDLSDPDMAFEIAARLTDYITTLEPLRRA